MVRVSRRCGQKRATPDILRSYSARSIRGMKIIKPDAFIPAAERYGLMAELDRWVIQKTVNCLTRPCNMLC